MELTEQKIIEGDAKQRAVIDGLLFDLKPDKSKRKINTELMIFICPKNGVGWNL